MPERVATIPFSVRSENLAEQFVQNQGGALSRSGDARIALEALKGHPTPAWHRRLSGAEMIGEDIPHRLTLWLAHGRPSGHLVVLAGRERAAAIECQFGDPPSDALCRRAGVGQPADTYHVAALLMIGIGI